MAKSAPIVITVKGDTDRILRALKEEPKLARRSAVSALNKTTAMAQTEAVRELSKAKKLPVRIVRGRTKVLKANDRKLFAKLIALTAGVPVDRLNPRELKRGISAAGRKFPHAFILQKTNPLVFERRVIGGKRAARLPIDRVKIDLQPEAETIFRAVTARVWRSKLGPVFDRELTYRLQRRAVA